MSESISSSANEPQSPAQCAARLKQLFPALFAGAPQPLKLRIQADIQERAPGEFSKAQLSAFLRRHTGATSYLIALTKASHRVDLDGAHAGELLDEHKLAAREELARRRTKTQERQHAEQTDRMARVELLQAFESTKLTRANFCGLKGIDPDALDGLLVQARLDLHALETLRAQPSKRFEPRRSERNDGRSKAPRGDGRGRPARDAAKTQGTQRPVRVIAHLASPESSPTAAADPIVGE